MKTFYLLVLCILLGNTTAQAAPLNFEGTWPNTEAWADRDDRKPIWVVDRNRLDNGPATNSASHAYGLRWDDTNYEPSMPTIISARWAFVYHTGYWGETDNVVRTLLTKGRWGLLGRTSDHYAALGIWGDAAFDFNTARITKKLLANGRFAYINAMMWFDALPDHAEDPLDIPLATPIRGAVWLLGGGLLAMVGIRKKNQ
ncbi:MAG: hypothetical protein HKP58_07325 [Desulfatitalea sp.]|nr:hypothetical protein [Desulfatitalea sp.]NNK00209.1 hypothetical protein [Desulfatitalea sp.]